MARAFLGETRIRVTQIACQGEIYFSAILKPLGRCCEGEYQAAVPSSSASANSPSHLAHNQPPRIFFQHLPTPTLWPSTNPPDVVIKRAYSALPHTIVLLALASSTSPAHNCDFRVGTWTYQKEKRDIPVVGRRRTWLQICARVAQQ